jgi:hypothetical protein
MSKVLRHASLLLCAMALPVLAGCGGDISVALPLGGGDASIYLFDPGVASDGIVTFAGGNGGRGTVDAFVASGSVPAACAGKTVRAFLSVSLTDSIANMPTNYGVPTDQPVIGALGPQIAADWADLLDGGIAVSLQSAIGLGNFFWSGSSDNGVAATHCSGWNSTANNGWNGRHDLASSTWLGLGASLCTATLPLVGICY